MDAPAPVAVERSIALDLARRALWVAPAVVLVAGLVRGFDGAASAGLGLGLAVANFLGTAAGLAWAARRSPATLATMALGGFVVRMAVLLGAMVLADALFGWVDVVVLGLTLFVTHLGLLFWELRSLSLTLAAPGLRRDRRVVKGVTQ
ncbi:MAG TPA: ATP synthase subunit I [Acidimicrobiia bacterium]|nr:ATP synthase subunit I [Acidimicrobiia bacterium]